MFFRLGWRHFFPFRHSVNNSLHFLQPYANMSKLPTPPANRSTSYFWRFCMTPALNRSVMLDETITPSSFDSDATLCR